MPTTPTYPGVYIEEIPSGVRTLAGVATSITAFVGRALRGPVNEPTRIASFADYERAFGGLWSESTMSYAVQQYFINGGSDAIIVRVHNQANRAEADLPVDSNGAALNLEATDEGGWGNNLRVRVTHLPPDLQVGEPTENLFNLSVKDAASGTVEPFFNLSTDPSSPRFVTQVLEQDSRFVRVAEPGTVPPTQPEAHPDVEAGEDPFAADPPAGLFTPLDGGTDGEAITDDQLSAANLQGLKQGIYALENADLFNMLVVPPPSRGIDVDPGTLAEALAYCKKRRAVLLVDGPSAWGSVADATADEGINGLRDENAALFWPRLLMPDPLRENRLQPFAPSGAVAGVLARTDAQRGIWKAPAGIDANLRGVSGLTMRLTDSEQGRLNPLGINCLRTFPVVGTVIWGARTLRGADVLASEWKYLPVRRVALYLEESLYRGTQWVVFEPNDEALWSQIRLNVGAFMHNLFRQGAFRGTSPKEAYFVKCDKETTTQNDINIGVVNVVVGFAPLKPAEFVVIKLQQMAGQLAA